MALTEKVYGIKIMNVCKLGWDLYKFRVGGQNNSTIPNPHCEEELDKAIASMKALLIQLKTHNVDSDGRDLNQDDRWWVTNIEKVTELV